MVYWDYRRAELSFLPQDPVLLGQLHRIADSSQPDLPWNFAFRRDGAVPESVATFYRWPVFRSQPQYYPISQGCLGACERRLCGAGRRAFHLAQPREAVKEGGGAGDHAQLIDSGSNVFG